MCKSVDIDYKVIAAFPIGKNTVIELNEMPIISIGQLIMIDDIKVKVIGIPMLPPGKQAIYVDKVVSGGQDVHVWSYVYLSNRKDYYRL